MVEPNQAQSEHQLVDLPGSSAARALMSLDNKWTKQANHHPLQYHALHHLLPDQSGTVVLTNLA